MKKEQERSNKYYALRKAGFTSVEANLLKDRTIKKVEYYCEINLNYLKWRNEIIKQEGRKHD